MRVVVIGATGHIGSYLVPRLVRRGHAAVCVSRRQRQPYIADECWADVTHAVLDRTAEEQHGQFGERIAALRPEVVIGLTCYTLERAEQLPNFGLETLHHVHADDVAQAFERAVERPDAAIGESFHVVSPAALTLRGYAEGMAAWYGVEAHLDFLPYDEWRAGVSDRDAAVT